MTYSVYSVNKGHGGGQQMPPAHHGWLTAGGGGVGSVDATNSNIKSLQTIINYLKPGRCRL